MPELPEVEHGRRVAQDALLDRRLVNVTCDDDPIVFDGVTPDQVRRALLGATVKAVRRHGKQLWFQLDRAPHPLFHFGMTGAFRTRSAVPLELESSSASDAGDAWPPRFTKILMRAENGAELAMTNKRRLGRIRLRLDPENEPPIADLGFDPLLAPPTPAEFVRALATRSANIKGLLLNQSFAAGVGNWIADEVLYQAGIDPRRSADGLTAVEARRLRKCLVGIVRKAVAVDARKERFPRTWLFHRRWGKPAAASTARGEPVEFLTIAGRTTAWVPSRQS